MEEVYMKGLYIKLVISLILILGAVSSSIAQRSNGLAVEGKISVEEGSVEGAVIQMYEDGRRLDNYGVGSDGNYKVELNYGHKFELIFSLGGNFPQKIVVDTDLPREVAQTNPSYPPFPVNVNLFTEIEGIDRTFSENTVLKIYYSPQVGNFISDLYYNNAQIKNLIDQAILQSQMIDREEDYLSRLTRAELAELRKEYDQLLKEADDEYGNEKFLDALDGYKAANQVFPNEQYPKDRIAEINDLLGIIMVAEEMNKALADRFNTLITNADQFFNNRQYFEARNSYNRALSIRPADNHANQRVKEINEILKNQQTEQQYQDLIVRGNNAFNEMLYDEALQIFTEALDLRPNESYPKSKINEIREKQAELARNTENQKNYDQAIFQGDLNYEKQFYDKALASYENALKYKPGDEKATNRISEIKELMGNLANRTLYEKFIDSADKAFKKDSYNEALTDYQKALEVFPDEAYPTERISVIRGIMQAEADFYAAVQKADEAFGAKQYRNAKTFYSQALELKASDKHSRDRINEIDGILASMQVDEQYNTIVAEADEMFNSQEYNNAKDKYTEALSIKSREQYPRDKIAEINNILRDIAALDSRYQQTIGRADNLFGRESYEEAKTVYAEAGNIKPEETYPPEMIQKIDSILDEQTRLLAEQQAAEQARLEALALERDRNYQQTVDEADLLVEQNDLVAAVSKFRAALEIKPEEQYPITRIEEIRGIISQRQEIQQAYDEAIAKADREFQREEFDTAVSSYNLAKSTKQDETYPDEMIARIDSIVNARALLAAEAEEAERTRLATIQAQKDSLYNATIASADNYFNIEEYDNARNEYRAALDVKPEEAYPQQRINEIGTILAQLSEAQKAYEDAIALGDREFNREAFDAAKTAFANAKSAKPDETYPDEMIARIDSIVETRAQLAAEAEAAEQARLAAIQAEKESLYNAAIASADSYFNAEEYENARDEYRSALNVKPEETYPQQRIDEIGTILAQLSEAQKTYEDAIALGDREFRREAFEESKTAFNNAKSAKPDETYPDEMLAIIDSIVVNRARLVEEAAAAEAARLAALQAEKDSLFNAAIVRADGFFNNEEYTNAKSEYVSALSIKAEEVYPQQQIDKINAIQEEQATAQRELEALNRNYQDAIRLADNFFNTQSFTEAKSNYEKALTLKPAEEYPAQKITEIDEIFRKQKVDEEYRTIILAADGYYRTESYTEAKSEYEKALTVKPDEQYPKTQINKIDDIFRQEEERILAEQQAATELEKRREQIQQQNVEERQRQLQGMAELDSLYENYIQLADNAFDNEEYNMARGLYFNAWDIKPEEIYPEQRINEINRLVNNLMANQRDRDYQRYINLADSTFRENQLAVARSWYNQALSIKSNEVYPREQIAEIQRLINQRLDSQSGDLFNEHIAKASEAFEKGEYTVARYWYRQALDLKPDDQEVKNKLNEINEALNR